MQQVFQKEVHQRSPLPLHLTPDDAPRNNNKLLREAIDEALAALGAPRHKTLLWHLSSRKVFSDPDNTDVNAFYMAMKELFGPGADMIMREIWKRFKNKTDLQAK
jgi:hypothetical protein